MCSDGGAAQVSTAWSSSSNATGLRASSESSPTTAGMSAPSRHRAGEPGVGVGEVFERALLAIDLLGLRREAGVEHRLLDEQGRQAPEELGEGGVGVGVVVVAGDVVDEDQADDRVVEDQRHPEHGAHAPVLHRATVRPGVVGHVGDQHRRGVVDHLAAEGVAGNPGFLGLNGGADVPSVTAPPGGAAETAVVLAQVDRAATDAEQVAQLLADEGQQVFQPARGDGFGGDLAEGVDDLPLARPLP